MYVSHMKRVRKFPEDFWLFVDRDYEAKLARNIAVVDVETTGLDPSTSKLICIGIADVYRDKIIQYFDEPSWDEAVKLLLRYKNWAAWNVYFDKVFLEEHAKFPVINCIIILSEEEPLEIRPKCWLELQPLERLPLTAYSYPFRVFDPTEGRAVRIVDWWKEYVKVRGRRSLFADLILAKNYADLVRESWWLCQYMIDLEYSRRRR